MKTTKLLCCCFIVVTAGCKKEKPETGIEKPIIPHDSQSVKVSFPDGIQVKYTDYSLFSLADDAKLDASGNATVAYNKKNTNIAWLFDKNNNPVMAGFVNDTAKTIDATSTAKVLLYYAYAIPMLPEPITDEFVNTIGGISGFSDWANKLDALLKADPLVVSKNGYLTALQHALENIAKEKAGNSSRSGQTDSWGKQASTYVKDINKIAVRNADITVSSGDAKSGLQVASEELSKVKITNYYRRRAHAFFYKTKFKDLSGTEKKILSEINETTAADKDESLSPTSAVNSFTGVLGNWIENRNSGEILDFAAKVGGPYNFPLQDHESEATYQVRIVGPGKWPSDVALTNAEKSKLFRLEVETFAMDFLIPLTASYVSSKIAARPGDSSTEQEKEAFNALIGSIQTVVEEMIKGSPAVYDEMKGGNYKAALTKLIESVYAGNANVVKEGFVKVIAILARNAVEKGFYVSPQYDEVLAQNRMMGILKITDQLLELSDYANIVYDIKSSRSMDEWELLLKSGKVTLQFVSGHDSLLNTSDETKIQAEIKNMNETGGDQHPYFEWSTTGKFGKLVDTKGHSGAAFATADPIVSYQSTTSSSDLDNGDNIDYIYVKASFNNVFIGMDTIAVNVRKVDYEVTPENAVVTGKKHAHAANSATLYLQKTDGKRDIPNNSIYDFKVEWSTPGSYGNLQGTTTTYNDDDMVYKATSEQPGIFNETVTARIYVKPKGSAEAYSFYGQDKVTVKVDNEEKKKILHVPIAYLHGDSTTMGGILSVCYYAWATTFSEDPDAVRYYARVASSSVNGSFPKGYPSYSWNASGPYPYTHAAYVRPPYANGQFCISFGNSGGTRLVGEHVKLNDPWASHTGVAEITIWLK